MGGDLLITPMLKSKLHRGSRALPPTLDDSMFQNKEVSFYQPISDKDISTMGKTSTEYY